MNAKKKGFAEPVFQVQFGGFDVQIHKDVLNEEKLLKKGLNEKLIKAVLFVKENGSISNTQYQETDNVSRQTASRDLHTLVEKGYLQKTGKTGIGTIYKFNASNAS